MRMRKSFLGGVSIVALVALGCDSTVGLDPSQTAFTNLVVPGACKSADNLSRVDFSVMLLGGTQALLPDSEISREPIAQLLEDKGIGAFKFRLTQDDRGTLEDVSSVVNCDLCGSGPTATMSKSGVGLSVTDFAFHHSGGENRRNKPKLVILLVDHSGSLQGINPTLDTDVNPARGTDRDDQRISFFLQLVGNLPSDHFMSLVKFQGPFPTIDPTHSLPTTRRDIIRDALGDLNYGEAGGTPLARALSEVYERIVIPNYESLNPVVVLFTDGVEDGDTSDIDLAEAMAKYASGPATDESGNPSAAVGAQVPIITMHLQQSAAAADEFDYPRGRSVEYQKLACATGGEYIFLERPEEFTESITLQTVVRNRLAGVWRLSTQTTLSKDDFPSPSGFLMATELTVTLGQKSRSFSMSRERQSGDVFNDTRIWLYKQ